MITTIVFAIYSFINFGAKGSVTTKDFIIYVIIFVTINLWTMYEFVADIYLILGAQQNNKKYLKVSYNYMKLKVPIYAGIILICMIVQQLGAFDTYYWFCKNVDGWMTYLLYENPACGILVVVIQLYLMLLINSLIHNLDHQQVEFTKIINEEIKEEVINTVMKIDDVC